MTRPVPIEPGPGQESVWDYPRPPRLEPTARRLRVMHAGALVAETTDGLRVLETSQPPAYYFPPADVDRSRLRLTPGSTHCEWKGAATYADVVVDDQVAEQASWWYPAPTSAFAAVADHVAFYAQKLTCFIDDEQVDPNAGSFYGGWITSHVVGPFKGAPGTAFW